jgi:hypothetical protein
MRNKITSHHEDMKRNPPNPQVSTIKCRCPLAGRFNFGLSVHLSSLRTVTPSRAPCPLLLHFVVVILVHVYFPCCTFIWLSSFVPRRFCHWGKMGVLGFGLLDRRECLRVVGRIRRMVISVYAMLILSPNL